VPGFDAEVRSSGRGSHAVVVPRAVVAELGTRRVLVRLGAESFETTLGAYGGRTFLGLRASLLTALGLVAGDQVHVELEPGTPVAESDPAEPSPLTCAELDAALEAEPLLRTAWEGLPPGHREEYGRWISGGADPEARQTRITRLRHRLLPA
jgi:antitoxin component of MazEF toxin-antitoxin module